MRTALIGAMTLGLAWAGGGVALASPVDDAEATVHAFVAAFDKGDIAAAAATNTADVSIVDEVPPHAWKGPGAFMAWAGDLMKDSAAAGQTDEQVVLGKLVRSEVTGDAGYVVINAAFDYKQHGKAMTEPSQMVFALRRDGGAWKISAWAWTGGVAKPA